MFTHLLQEGGLSFDRLQSFCLVAQAGGVTKAAKGDPAKQSLFSRQIKELEEFFGTELIRRKGRGVTLSEAGERLNIIARLSHFPYSWIRVDSWFSDERQRLRFGGDRRMDYTAPRIPCPCAAGR